MVACSMLLGKADNAPVFFVLIVRPKLLHAETNLFMLLYISAWDLVVKALSSVPHRPSLGVTLTWLVSDLD